MDQSNSKYSAYATSERLFVRSNVLFNDILLRP